MMRAAMANNIKKVGVLGCGLMGSGIAQVSAQAGYDTVVVEVEQKFLDKGIAGIDKSLGKFVEKGKLSSADKDSCMNRLKGSTSLKDLAECDIVVEAITENPKIKKETYTAIDSIVKKEAIFASNTSSLTITELSMATTRPKQFVGLHFFNPVPLMKLVEVVRTILTTEETFNTAFEWAKSLGKEAVSCRDNSGFIVNRLLVPYILDAIRAYEEGVGSVEDIDKAMQLGCGYPMGPFTLLDFVGLDTTYFITDVMFNEYREKRFAAPPLLRKMVLAGRFGRKSGAGFYDYSGEKPVAFDRVK
jgi:3-hydroxybutyryl-CoA dehydrogenase